MKDLIIFVILGLWCVTRIIRNLYNLINNAYIGYHFDNLPDIIAYPLMWLCEVVKAIIFPSLIFLYIYLHYMY